MTQLAIIGHKTRSKEVIEILEMLGYINLHNYVADCDSLCFYGGKCTGISYIYYDWVNDCFADENVAVFALEEFLEKYPYKVGDKVIVKGLSEYPKIINFMKWFDGDIHYSFDNETWFLPSALNLYKEETMEVKRMAFAITGHKTRGKEVIEILEMLGGINTYKYSGENEEICFAIGGATKMIYYNWINDWLNNCYGDEGGLVFTLEEFLEKYPYKVGDRVRIPEYESEVCISKMLWNGNEVLYEVVVGDEVERYSAEELNEFNEPNKEEIITIDDFKANTKEWLIDKLHDMVISKAIKTIGDIHEELHKPQYPKTYDECVDMFNCSVETVNLETLKALRELIYCRNAYWKIAGEQMGLGKPWEPEYPSEHYIFTIENQRGNIIKNAICDRWRNRLLIFPTEEIRDMFYENFKEMIEKCKEFL